MTEQTKFNIINSICGTNENGFTKARVIILNEIWMKDKKETINQVVVDNAIVDISPIAGYVHASLSFASNKDVDLIYLNRTINNFIEKYKMTETEMPMMTFIFQPYNPAADEDDVTQYCVAYNPIMWCLTSKEPDEMPNVYKVCFDETNFNICEEVEEE